MTLKESKLTPEETTTNTFTEKDFFSPEGEIPCLLIYSDEKHVKDNNLRISSIEKVLKTQGFKPRRLGDEIKSDENYFTKLEELIEQSTLGVILLDGFRPNVLFEYGFFKGMKKPVIILQGKDAYISIKTLYPNFKDTGLSKNEFEKKIS